jgi:hypothetical protein
VSSIKLYRKKTVGNNCGPRRSKHGSVGGPRCIRHEIASVRHLIIQSIWLQDVILLQHSCGVNGLAELFEAGALQFECGGLILAQTGQLTPSPPLPLFHYQFSRLNVQGAEERIERTLSGLAPNLRDALVKGRVSMSEDYAKIAFGYFYRDLKTELVDFVVRKELRRRGIIPVSHHVHVEAIDEEDRFNVTSDLPHAYRMSPFDAHKLVEAALMTVGRVSQHLTSMYTHLALADLSEYDRDLLQAKLGMIAESVVPVSSEDQFSRVVSLKGLAVPEYGTTVLDVNALLKVRQSDECICFKSWLSGVDRLSDKEVRERFSGFGRRIRESLHSRVGKQLKFLLSSGIGVAVGQLAPVVGAVAGVGLAAIDSFLLERLAPKDSVLSFLNDGYRSVLKPGDDKL